MVMKRKPVMPCQKLNSKCLAYICLGSSVCEHPAFRTRVKEKLLTFSVSPDGMTSSYSSPTLKFNSVVRIKVEVLMVQVSSLQEISTTGVEAAIICRARNGTPVQLHMSDQFCQNCLVYEMCQNSL